MPGFCGALTSTTRFPSGIHSRARLFTSASEMPGSTRAYESPLRSRGRGTARACVKFLTYSPASVADWRLSFSASVCVRPRRRSVFSRSSSVAVKPKRTTRSASVNIVSSALSMLFSFAIAISIDASADLTNSPRPAPAFRNGASGFCASSLNRAESMLLKSRSTICCR